MLDASPRHDLAVVLVIAVAVVLVSAVAAAVVVVRSDGGTAVAAIQPRPPVLGVSHDAYDGDLGDPFVLPVTAGGRVVRYVAFGTGDWPARIPTAHSSDLTTWTAGPDALPTLPRWAGADPTNSLSWAPAALETSDGYILYVSLPDARSGQQCIGAATSKVPEGPFTGVGDGPLVCQHDLGGSIDPSVIRDRSGHVHLLWKNDGNSVGVPAGLWQQQLADDGLRLVATAHRLLTASRPWQAGIVEEPAIIPASGSGSGSGGQGWWLFYSGNAFDRPEYATGLAFCPTLDGPCRDVGDGPFLATAALSQFDQFAPGGLETFRDGHGALWAVFDTWNRPARGGVFHCCRSLQLVPVRA